MFAVYLPALAETSLSADAATLTHAMVFIGGLTAVAVIGNQIMSAWLSLRKLRGSDPGDDLRYATRQEHQALRDEVVVIKGDISSLARTINNQFADIQRSLGRLEGKIDAHIPQCRKPSQGG